MGNLDKNRKGIKGVFENIFGRAWPYWLGGLLIGLFNVFEYILGIKKLANL